MKWVFENINERLEMLKILALVNTTSNKFMFVFLYFSQNVGFHTPGSLRLCTTPERMDEAKYQMQRQGWHKAPQWLVTPDEIAKMHPLLKMDDVLGGLFNPGQFYCSDYSISENYLLWNPVFNSAFQSPDIFTH